MRSVNLNPDPEIYLSNRRARRHVRPQYMSPREARAWKETGRVEDAYDSEPIREPQESLEAEERLPAPPATPSAPARRASGPWVSLTRIWRERPCFICGRSGRCGHREPRVDLAELRAEEVAGRIEASQPVSPARKLPERQD